MFDKKVLILVLLVSLLSTILLVKGGEENLYTSVVFYESGDVEFASEEEENLFEEQYSITPGKINKGVMESNHYFVEDPTKPFVIKGN